MAIYKTRTELRNFELSNGKTVDLITLIDTIAPSHWVAPSVAPEIGTTAYVDAMGAWRRGAVVKTTKTKVHVAVTTQGAVDQAARSAGWGGQIRVQIVIADTNYVRVAPPAEPVAEPSSRMVALREVRYEEALREDYARGQVAAAGGSWGTHLMKFDGTVLPREGVLTDGLTPNSQAGKVDDMNETTEELDSETDPETLTPAETEAAAIRETTGSAVVKLLERVHERIRQNHPEVPAVVMVTGAGTELGSSKWGHFRSKGWTTADKVSIHEMFMAGETLAKGSKQVLQTMLHESAHALAEARGQQDTSRQGRWHNKTFLKTAEEMGLKHSKDKADKAHGYSFVVLTDATLDEYRDLLEELDREIHLMVKLPFWLGGDAGESGGEGMGKKPTEGGESKSTNLKLTCLCEEPNIIRASKKVAEKNVINCGDCDATFEERG